MKQALSKSLILATFVVLSACDKGGGGESKKEAAVIPGPQGRVQAQSNPNTYCDFNNTTGSMICYAVNPANVSQSCNTGTQPYSSLQTLCQNIIQLQRSMQCNVQEAINLVYHQQNCAAYLTNQQSGLNGIPQNNGLPQNTDVNFKSVQCEFEAYRISQGRWIRREIRTPKLTAQISFDGRMRQDMDLRSKFLGFDIGNFGRTKMTYMPAGIKGTADTLTISNQGLNETMTLSQSGFAGQPVKMDLMSDDGQMKLSVSCAGQAGVQFKKNSVNKAYTSYVCRGSSSLYGSHREQIEVSFPFDSSLVNTELAIADNLTAVVTGDSTGTDTARITFSAIGVGTDISLITSANLKATSVLKASDGLTNVDLTCGPQ